MDLYGQKSKSIPQKIVIHILEIVLLWLAWWIMFDDGGPWVQRHLHIRDCGGGLARRKLLFAFDIVIFVRLAFMMFFMLKRKIPWEESVSVPVAFALYYVGFPLFVLPVDDPLGVADILAIVLFVTGSVLNTGGEILRDKWKKNPEHKGRLYTTGFFRYSRHINYFGDILWVSGCALATKNPWAVTVPIFLFCFFAFYNAPMLDRHLKQKYGAEYDEYARRTRMLIPFVF